MHLMKGTVQKTIAILFFNKYNKFNTKSKHNSYTHFIINNSDISGFTGSKGVQMEYQIFLSDVKERLVRELPSGVHVENYKTTKNNGEVRQGFVFQKRDEGIFPIVYMEDYYEQYLRGMEIKSVTDGILEWYNRTRDIPAPVLEAQHLENYDHMKTRIVYRLINREKNKTMLEKVPHRLYLDFGIVFYVLFSVEKYSAISMLITNEHLNLWGITEEELNCKAWENTPRILPAEMQDIQEAVMELFPENKKDEEFTGFMYVLTNEQRSYGAATILYPGLLEMIGNEWKENFYILPSSIHEVLLVPESKSPGIQEMREAVYSINRTEVSEEEFLSDTVYYYNCGKKELCM